MCSAFFNARLRFLDNRYAPSNAALFAAVQHEAESCRMICGESAWNTPQALSRLANITRRVSP